MEIQSVEAGQMSLSRMADSKPLHTLASELEQRRPWHCHGVELRRGKALTPGWSLRQEH